MRKLELTYKLIDEICTYIENGNTNRDTCSLVGITEATFYSWLSDAEKALNGEEVTNAEIKVDFLEAIRKAEAGFKAFHINNITQKSKKEWTASAWLLERKFPKEWGRIDRNSVTIHDGDGMLKDMMKLIQSMADGTDEEEEEANE